MTERRHVLPISTGIGVCGKHRHLLSFKISSIVMNSIINNRVLKLFFEILETLVTSRYLNKKYPVNRLQKISHIVKFSKKKNVKSLNA